MLYLVDLDGTLISTEGSSFKEYKDGKKAVDPSVVPLKPGALEFIRSASEAGNSIVIVSDSHPRYVTPIAEQLFGGIPSIPLCDKPNLTEVKKGLVRLGIEVNPDETILLGDTWLDIHLGRGLGVPTILLETHEKGAFDARDGIGESHKNYNAGPTYTARNFDDVASIIENPLGSLLAIEAGFQGASSRVPRSLHTNKDEGWFVRALARQVDGERDRFDTTNYYREFETVGRKDSTLDVLADSVSAYLRSVVEYPKITWDFLAGVPDKATTVPQDKMAAIMDRLKGTLNGKLTVENLMTWKDTVSGSIRSIKTRDQRLKFVEQHLTLIEGVASKVRGKNIIVLDDQYTTGATAETVRNLLRTAGAECIVFVAMYQLVDAVVSDRPCPVCGKLMKLKVRRDGSSRFYSCVPPKYKGDGCGGIVNID